MEEWLSALIPQKIIMVEARRELENAGSLLFFCKVRNLVEKSDFVSDFEK